MKINSNLNYCILSNEINNNLLSKYSDYQIIDEVLNYAEAIKQIDIASPSRVVFKETWYNLKEKEIKELLTTLQQRNIKYINITSNIEEVIYADYVIVYDHNNIVLEGPLSGVLKEEKTLKRLGYGLPFAVDLSTQLKYYDILDTIYYDNNSLEGALWN